MRTLPRSTLPVLALALAAWGPAPAVACDRCQPKPRTCAAPRVDTAALLNDLDSRAAAAASARPSFALPARIGIARIEGGVTTPMPADEWACWRALRDQMASTVGQLSPVSALVAQSLTTAPVSGTPHDSITHLRLAAAREQLDAILLYEVSTTHSLEQTELTLLDATIVGAWWFPTHRSHMAAHASATLIDARSGLAYGSAIGNATDACSATLLGSEDKILRQRTAAVRKSVAALTPEVGTLLTRLAQAPRPAGARTPAPAAPSSAPGRAPAPSPAGSDHVIPPPANDGEGFWRTR